MGDPGWGGKFQGLLFLEEMDELNSMFFLMWSHSLKTSTWNLKNGWFLGNDPFPF